MFFTHIKVSAIKSRFLSVITWNFSLIGRLWLDPISNLPSCFDFSFHKCIKKLFTYSLIWSIGMIDLLIYFILITENQVPFSSKTLARVFIYTLLIVVFFSNFWIYRRITSIVFSLTIANCYHDKWPDWAEQQSVRIPGKTTAMISRTSAMITGQQQWNAMTVVYALLTVN